MRSMLFVPGDRPERFAKADRERSRRGDLRPRGRRDAGAPSAGPRRHRRVPAQRPRARCRCGCASIPSQTDDALADLAAIVAAGRTASCCRRPAAAPTCIASITGSRRSRPARSCAWLDQGDRAGHRDRQARAERRFVRDATRRGSSATAGVPKISQPTWARSANRTADGEFEFTFRHRAFVLPADGGGGGRRRLSTRPTSSSVTPLPSSAARRPRAGTDSSASSRFTRRRLRRSTPRSPDGR